VLKLIHNSFLNELTKRAYEQDYLTRLKKIMREG
jgi:hypothetical protein